MRRVAILLLLLACGLRQAGASRNAGFHLDLDTGGHRAFIKDIAFTGDGQYLVSASDDKTIRIWDWQSGRDDPHAARLRRPRQ